ncbi:MAG: ATP-binding protein [Gammaproteobacteria bacterium]|nr:ATP-binding protein [Gammaproteobacteria bacterium]
MTLDLRRCREHLQNFRFTELFVQELGWNHPERLGGHLDPQTLPPTDDTAFSYRHVSELGGVVVLLMECGGDGIPGSALRGKIHRQVEKRHREHLLIFADRARTQCLWSWLKRGAGSPAPRSHSFFKGQSGDLFIAKLSRLFFDISDFDRSGGVSVSEVARRLQDALDVQGVTKRFYGEFQQRHDAFLQHIEGIDDERDRKWYASVLLNRLMFVWFLQKKGFVNRQDFRYLQTRLQQSQARGPDRYYREFLQLLFFEGFAKPAPKRSAEARRLLGDIRYLDGGLFVPHPIEQRWPRIRIPDRAFAELYRLFDGYSWHLDDTPGGADNEINPDVLGYIFEKYINQKAFGAYYTRTEITEHLCEHTVHRLILERVNAERAGVPALGVAAAQPFDSVPEMLMRMDADLCRRLVLDGRILQRLAILDPACGSGAFLVAAMKALIDIYAAVIGRIEVLNDTTLNAWLHRFRAAHPSIPYGIKKRIVTHNLFGVDLMEEAGEICKLRLFLTLVASAAKEQELEPLPNIDFNIMPGNSLVGLLRVAEEEFADRQGHLFRKSYREAVAEYEREVQTYRATADYSEDLRVLRDRIEELRCETAEVLDDILLDKFVLQEKDRQGRPKKIQYEQAAWNKAAGKPGKPKKRTLTRDDIAALKPFHWGFVFNEVLNARGGFDIILTNPPWETFKPNGKEFFERHSELVSKKKVSIKQFEKRRRALMKDPEIRTAWLEYMSGYPHQSQWFRVAEQYRRQFSATVGGKKVGSDINLYKLFLEQCHNLLCEGGHCGIVIPSGIYTDLGAKGLREMLFAETRVGGLFGFENRSTIFENVDSRFKFVVLTFCRGEAAEEFPAAFMRHEAKELADFPERGAVKIPVRLIRKLSPDSLSLMEFKSRTDRKIVEKMLRFPLLGEQIEDAWNIRFRAEFHMTNDSHLFHVKDAPGRLPLYEGKMIWQFDHQFAPDKLKYWINERKGRASLLGRTEDTGQKLDYQNCRFGVRAIASNTNERTLIAGPIPRNAFCGNSILVAQPALEVHPPSEVEMLVIQAILNSYVVDYFLRMKVTTNINMFYLYQLPIPRLSKKHPAFPSIVNRAARLVCTTPEFDALAAAAGIESHRSGATEPAERAALRAELDAQIARLYNLTEPEYRHILGTFPLVAEPIKTAARQAY